MTDRYLFRGFHPCESGMESAWIEGKEIKGEWKYGHIVKGCDRNGQVFIARMIGVGFFTGGVYADEVLPETVGQYTGLKDKNGKQIYEGDIVTCIEYECFGYIEWNQSEASFYFAMVFEGCITEEESMYDYVNKMEIIGSIHSNPDILERKEK